MHGIAESLAEISQNTDRIASVLEAAPAIADRDDLLYDAWAIIANAGWDGLDKTPGWQETAVRWRDAYHRTLPNSAPQGKPEEAV